MHFFLGALRVKLEAASVLPDPRSSMFRRHVIFAYCFHIPNKIQWATILTPTMPVQIASFHCLGKMMDEFNKEL